MSDYAVDKIEEMRDRLRLAEDERDNWKGQCMKMRRVLSDIHDVDKTAEQMRRRARQALEGR